MEAAMTKCMKIKGQKWIAPLAIGVLLCGVLLPAQGAFDWRKMLGVKTKPQRVWTPKRGPVFDWKKLAYTPLEARVLKTELKDGIVTKSVTFHSEMDGKKRVDIFAYFSYPVGAKGIPAFVWIEGGLAQAKPYRTQFGARRGYATIAIDFPQPGYRSTGDYPINLGMYVGENPRQAPIYHGAVALLKAVTFLEAQPQVDKERIGMAGSSWGGFYTTLMTGIDPRIKASACLFGTGNLQMGNMWWDAYGRSAQFKPILREHWRKTLDPAWRLPRCKTPIAWFTATNDWFFWMPSMMRTYEMAGGPKSLTLVPNWDHALPGEIVDQAFCWLEAHLKGKPGLLKVTPLNIEERDGALWAKWKYDGPRRAKSADVIVSWGEGGNWNARVWQTVKANFKAGECQIKLPPAKGLFYISGSVTDTLGYRVSTPLRRINPQIFGGRLQTVSDEKLDPVLATDGCAEWGRFEWNDCHYLRRHSWWKNRNLHKSLTRDAFSGQKALILESGNTRLPLLRFTQGYKHRLTFWAKADAPTSIAVRLNAAFAGRRSDVLQWLPVGVQWTKIEVDVMPHEDLFHRYNASIFVPENTLIKVDEFSFRPVSSGVMRGKVTARPETRAWQLQ
jgi:dienelactone hydrolase